LSKFVAEIVELFGSEGIKRLGKLFGDFNFIEDDVFSNNLHMLLWAFNNIDDVVEIGPVHFFLINSLTSWDGLLELLYEGNNFNNTSYSFSWFLVFKGLLKSIYSSVENQSRLISLINAS